jgi:hypothetical protein
MKTEAKNIIQSFEAAAPAQYDEIRNWVNSEGYAVFSEFLEWMKDKIKRYEDHEMREIQALLNKAMDIFPEPGDISPSWQDVWKQYQAIIKCKNDVLQKIPNGKRDGEWQIIVDNPYSNESIICYPALTFLEAAYLYGYYGADLKRNEYIRLQKIGNVITHFGA